MTYIDNLLFLRFIIGYPLMAAAGLVLGVIALGRLRCMTNARRPMYKALVVIAFGLAWCGFWGVLGVWQYGQFVTPLPFGMPVVSVAFSIGVLWIGLSLSALAIIVLVDEYQTMVILRGNRGQQ